MFKLLHQALHLRFPLIRSIFKPLRWKRKIVAYGLLVVVGIGLSIFPNRAGVSSEITHSALVRNAELQFQQGQTLYERGEYDAAIATLQQAIATFEATDNPLNGAIARGNLALAYQQRGRWELAQETLEQSLTLLDSLGAENHPQVLASLLEIQSQLKLSLGHPDVAIDLWEKAGRVYQKLGDKAGVLRCEANQSLALQKLGKYRDALHLLLPRAGDILELDDSFLKATALRSLGNVARVVGDKEIIEQVLSPFVASHEAKPNNDLDWARWLLQHSYQAAKDSNNSQSVAESLIGLGHLERAAYYRAKDAYDRVPTPVNEPERQLQFEERAIQYYQNAQSLAISQLTQVEAQLNQLSFWIEIGQRQEPEFRQQKGREQINEQLVSQLRSRLDALPSSSQLTFARINLARNLMEQDFVKYRSTIETVLLEAKEEAQQLKDARSQSYALGNLGKLYQLTGNRDRALQLTQKALLLAEEMQAFEIRYQWEWQLGKLLAERAKITDAISTYEETIDTVDRVRLDLLDLKNPDVRFTFRDNVEPVYREYMNLLLDRSWTAQKNREVQSKLEQENLEKARAILERLQVAELENYLRCSLQSENQNSLDRIIEARKLKAATLHVLVLRDRLDVILKLPQSQQLIHHAVSIDRNTIEGEVAEVLNNIKDDTIKNDDPRLKDLYEILIKPIESSLKNSSVETIVFVLDRSLRNFPVSTLYDGQQSLIEKYSIALNLGLESINSEPLPSDGFDILLAGVSAENLTLSALPGVDRLLELMKEKDKLRTTVLRNEEFTPKALQDLMKSQNFPVVHLATHGQFSSSADETFVAAWGEKINIDRLGKYLQSRVETQPEPINLLVLDACKTAVGDKRAALGIAGVSVRAGAQSTIASIANIRDESTAILMNLFYQELSQSNVTKAEALRRAQVMLWQEKEKYKKPYYWSPYILVGNWY